MEVASKRKAAADRGWRDHRLAECVQQGPQGAPSGAMRRHDLLQRELLQMRHGVGNQPLHRRTRQMQAAEYSIQWYLWKHLAGVQEDIDDARMRARTEDDESLPLHVDRHVAFV